MAVHGCLLVRRRHSEPESSGLCLHIVIYLIIFCHHRRGLNACQAEYAVKKYRSNRRIGAQIMMDMEIMNNPA